MVVAMIAGSLFGYALARYRHGQGAGGRRAAVGHPDAFPLPSFDPEIWRTIFPAALALTVLGLTEAVSIARAVAIKSGQRIDGNQEFIGQGLSNIVGAFSSACPSSGSFNRSGINYEAGARTPLAAVFSAVLLVAVLLAVAPLAAYLPLAVMAGLLFVVAWGLIDFAAMRRIVRASRGDALVLAVTFVSTLAIQLEFAIFVGVLASLLVYLNRTTHPHLTPIVPDRTSPQRRSVAVADVRAAVRSSARSSRCCASTARSSSARSSTCATSCTRPASPRPERRHLLLIGSGINFIDVAGAELLVQEAKLTREAGGMLYLCNLKPPVRDLLERGGFLDSIGRDCVFEAKDDAIRAIYARLDSARCRSCEARIFIECAATLPDGSSRTAA